jgi:hypothetical protein
VPERGETVSDVIDVETCYRQHRAVQVSKLGIVLHDEDSLPRAHDASVFRNDSLRGRICLRVYSEISGHLIVPSNIGIYRNGDAKLESGAILGGKGTEP